MLKKLLMVAGFAVAMVLSTAVAHADTMSVTVNNVQFTATVTSTTATLTVQCLDPSVCGDWYLGDVTLKGLDFTGDPTLGTAPSGYTVTNGGQNNNAVGSAGGGCNSTQPGQAICWDASLPLTTQLGSGVITFTANITNGSAPGTLAVMATGYNNSDGSQQGGGKVLTVSNDLVSAPEPGTLLLLGAGLLGLAVFRRRAFST